MVLVFGKQKTAYEMRMSDWSSDVCSCDLRGCRMNYRVTTAIMLAIGIGLATGAPAQQATSTTNETPRTFVAPAAAFDYERRDVMIPMRDGVKLHTVILVRSEEHTSELQSLMRISYAVFCLKQTDATHENL